MRPTRAKKNAKFQKNFGAPRSQKLREIGQRCCANLRTSLELFFESVCVLMHDCARVQRREHTKFAQKIRRNFAKFWKIRHGPRSKKCMRLASVRCANCTMSLRVDRVSIAFRPEKKESVERRNHANFAPNSREKNCKVFEKFGATRTKIARTRPALLRKPKNSLIRPFFGWSKLAKFLMRLLIVILNKLVRIITRRNRLVSKIALEDHLVGFFCVTGSIFSWVGGALGYHSSFFILHSFLFQGVRVRGKG